MTIIKLLTISIIIIVKKKKNDDDAWKKMNKLELIINRKI